MRRGKKNISDLFCCGEAGHFGSGAPRGRSPHSNRWTRVQARASMLCATRGPHPTAEKRETMHTIREKPAKLATDMTKKNIGITSKTAIWSGSSVVHGQAAIRSDHGENGHDEKEKDKK